MSFIAQTSATRRLIELLNSEGLPAGTLSSLLHLLSEVGQAANLSEQDKRGMAKRLKVTDSREIDQLLSFCAYIFDRATYFSLSPAKLAAALVEAGLAEDKSQAFGEEWALMAKERIEKARSETLGAPNKFASVNWTVGLTARTKDLTREKTPTALLQLNTQQGEAEKEKVTIEFNHDELYMFLKKLDTVQEQIDQLMP
eukprot:CAMPEP_0113908322 /NCGR_PEP_ID=MMETSP0780_2-20120614/26087_1 /TAXON_ID=652834 /ORGANISM="Palpitomonas bilix" /LENGTH=198 /DNA_ID=CAMNT_0000903717 /DNA_START=195 /DNA_END=791 /DNA_ORIENTATION=- /assembly_acc=CAM_ASM_000599